MTARDRTLAAIQGGDGGDATWGGAVADGPRVLIPRPTLAETKARRRERNKHSVVGCLVQAHPRRGLVQGRPQRRVRRLESVRIRSRVRYREGDSVLTHRR